MNEDKIKEAFLKAKQDILSLNSAISSLKQEIEELKQMLIKQTNRQTDKPTITNIYPLQRSTHRNLIKSSH